MDKETELFQLMDIVERNTLQCDKLINRLPETLTSTISTDLQNLKKSLEDVKTDFPRIIKLAEEEFRQTNFKQFCYGASLFLGLAIFVLILLLIERNDIKNEVNQLEQKKNFLKNAIAKEKDEYAKIESKTYGITLFEADGKRYIKTNSKNIELVTWKDGTKGIEIHDTKR